MRNPTDQEVREWAERHDVACGGAHLTDARAAFEDAQTLCSDSAAPGGDVEQMARGLLEQFPLPAKVSSANGYDAAWAAGFNDAIDLCEKDSIRAIIAALSAPKQVGAGDAGELLDGLSDTFKGDDLQLLSSARALLDLDKSGALVPHGIGGHARGIIEAFIIRMASPQPAPQPVEAERREDVWGRFASWLLDHCEGMIISEEMLQQQLDVMLATSSKQDPAEAEELRSCAICGLTVDLSNGHTKPTIDFGMAGRSKPKAPQPEQPAIDLEGLAMRVREALDRAACPDAFMRIAVEALIDGAKAWRGSGVECTIGGWIHEDQLPEGYPYNKMFPFSGVDTVRIFPVYVPIATTPASGVGRSEGEP